MQLETIRATLTADSGQFVQGMNRAQGAMAQLTTNSGHSSRAMNILKSGMVNLATQATGTAGPIGKLAQGLLMFGGGSALVLGVAAGIGLIASAYNALTADAREAAKANEDFAASLAKMNAHARLITERANLKDLEDQLAGARRGKINPMDPSRFIVDPKEIARIQELIRVQKEAIAFWDGQAGRQIAIQSGLIAAAAEREAEARMRSLQALDKMVTKMPSKESVEQLDAEARLKELSITGMTKHNMEPLGAKMRHGLELSGMSEETRQFGISLGRQLAMGMMEGFESMQDLLKAVLMSVLDFGIGMFLNSIIPGAGVVTGGVKGSAVGPAQMNMNMNMSGLQPITAWAIARDPNFQQVIRESVLVAASQGFRGGK